MWPVAGLLFVSCFVGVYLLMERLMAPRLAVAERLAAYTQPSVQKARDQGRWSGIPLADRIMGRMDFSRSLELLLEQTDLPIKPFEFVLITALSMLITGAIGLFVTRRLEIAFLLGVVGLLAPIVWVHFLRNRRRAMFARQLPDALQAISNALRAGYGFSQGMAIVAGDHPAPISSEFARAQRELNLGLTVEDVLQNMAQRMQSTDFDLAVSGILINRQVGGNLAELLDQITATIRERVKLKTFIQVLTAEQRLSAMIIIAVPPVLLAILLFAWREYTSYLLVTRAGQVMMAVAACFQVLGAYVIKRIVAIDV